MGHDLNCCQTIVKTADKCRAECQKHEDCVGWVWADEDHACCIKSKMEGRQVAQNMVAGLRDCVGQ